MLYYSQTKIPFCVSSGMDKERTCCVWQKQSLQLEDSMEAAEERLVRGWQKNLGIKCYDSELLDRAAKDSGMCQEIFENHDERPTNSFLYSLVMDTYSMGYSSSAFADMPINHKVFSGTVQCHQGDRQRRSLCYGWPLCRLRAGRQSESGICFRSCASGKIVSVVLQQNMI